MTERIVGWKCLRPTCLNLCIRPAMPRGQENLPPEVCDRCRKIGAFAWVPLVYDPEKR